MSNSVNYKKNIGPKEIQLFRGCATGWGGQGSSAAFQVISMPFLCPPPIKSFQRSPCFSPFLCVQTPGVQTSTKLVQAFLVSNAGLVWRWPWKNKMLNHSSQGTKFTFCPFDQCIWIKLMDSRAILYEHSAQHSLKPISPVLILGFRSRRQRSIITNKLLGYLSHTMDVHDVCKYFQVENINSYVYKR